MQCGVCGGANFTKHRVLWARLIEEWQLSPHETEYIDRQQGETCDRCGANRRSSALAKALCAFLGTASPLIEALSKPPGADLSILEINEAGTLTPYLKQCGGHVLGTYPQVDIHRLPFPDETFDVVIHSDTLEHVENPIQALVECRRVLRPDGGLCFTVPMIVGRLTRDRHGLPPSYHGNPAIHAPDYLVQTEFGADAWTYLFEAGFASVSLHACAYPAGLAFLAKRR